MATNFVLERGNTRFPLAGTGALFVYCAPQVDDVRFLAILFITLFC